MPELPITTRMWGAVMTDDGPVAEVRDVTLREEWDALCVSDTFRTWAMSAVGFASKGHTRGKCEPGAPCKKCHERAATWWWEHGKRTKARHWSAVKAEARTRNGWALADWGERRESLEEALHDAREAGWPLVHHSDGHGRTLEWIGVAE